MNFSALTFKLAARIAAMAILMPLTTTAAEPVAKPRKPTADQSAVVCLQGGACLQPKTSTLKSEVDRRARRSPLWFLEEIFFN